MIIKVGLKANAAFLFSEMGGDTLGGREGGVLYRSVMYLSISQFGKFIQLITAFGGSPDLSITRADGGDVDCECYFAKR